MAIEEDKPHTNSTIVTFQPGESRQLLESGEMTPESNYSERELILQEKEAWHKVLGTDVEVLPLPEHINRNLINKLKNFMKMELRFIPSLTLLPNILRASSLVDYQDEIALVYPNWRRFETLTREERIDYTIPRNLELHYWKMAKNGMVTLPNLPGQWMAVEMKESVLMNAYLDIDVRNDSSNRIKEKIDLTRNLLNTALKLPESTDLRLLSAVELNLLGNREGWGKDGSRELTGDVFLGGLGENLVIGCPPEFGGYGGIMQRSSVNPEDTVSFRVAMVF